MRKRMISLLARVERTPGRSTLAGLTILAALALYSPNGRQVEGQSTGTLRIYLARHGQTDWNAERRLQGSTDTELNAAGRQQAARLAGLLKGIRFDAVYSSTLRRSRDTAEIARGQVALTSLEGLAERRLGKFQGKRVDSSDPPTAAEYERRRRVPEDALDGGESLNQFFERVRATIGSIRGRHSGGSILIVGHGLTNQMILRSLLGLSFERAVGIDQANDEVYLIEIEAVAAPRLWKLVTESNFGDL